MSEPVVDAIAAANPAKMVGNNGAPTMNKKPFDMRIIIGIVVVLLIIGIILAAVFGSKAAEEAKAAEVKPPSTVAPAPAAAPAATPAPAATAGQGDSSKWKCVKGFTAPMRKDTKGDVQCMSSNKMHCLWKETEAQCQAAATTPVTPLNPLTCGDGHKAVWGSTGYDNPDHWCSQVKKLI